MSDKNILIIVGGFWIQMCLIGFIFWIDKQKEKTK